MIDHIKETSQGVTAKSHQVSRRFEQAPDAPSFYSDVVQILGTGNEVILQFYETIPNAPGASGQIEGVRSRLRATVITSPNHAASLGNNLLQHATKVAPTAAPKATEGVKS